MSSIVIAGNTSGTCTLSAPDVAGSTTLTLPTTTSTLSFNGPAFSAYQSTLQAVANNSATKIQFQTKEFDTNTNFDATTNYRFTPTIAGYYQINGGVYYSASVQSGQVQIFKNGTVYKLGNTGGNIAQSAQSCVVSSIVYCNGSTDYIELYAYQNSGGSVNTTAGGQTTYFNGALIRGA